MEKSVALDQRRQLQIDTAKRLRDKEGLGATEIARRMGVRNESTVREWFKQDEEGRVGAARKTANELKKIVDEKGMVDVGKNVERELGISRKRLDTALYILQKEGYNVV